MTTSNKLDQVYRAGFSAGMGGHNYAQAYARAVDSPELYGDMFAYGYDQGYSASE